MWWNTESSKCGGPPFFSSLVHDVRRTSCSCKSHKHTLDRWRQKLSIMPADIFNPSVLPLHTNEITWTVLVLGGLEECEWEEYVCCKKLIWFCYSSRVVHGYIDVKPCVFCHFNTAALLRLSWIHNTYILYDKRALTSEIFHNGLNPGSHTLPLMRLENNVNTSISSM